MKPGRGAMTMLSTGALILTGCSDDASSDAASAQVDCGGTSSLEASGSSAQANAMDLFVDAFEQACSNQTVAYTANGSGDGVREFLAGTTDFAGTDTPLTTEQAAAAKQRCDGADAWHLPVVFGPLAIVFNLAEVDTLALDAPTLARIFNGDITTWDDPAITRLNQSMPALPIRVVHRDDESGSTDAFQRYLAAASEGTWTGGTGQTWRGAGDGADGTEETAEKVNRTDGAISYVEWSFALDENLEFANILTPASKDPVRISPESVGKTIAAATEAARGNDLVLDDASFYTHAEDGAYPIVLATYEVVCSKYPEPDTATAVKAFLESTLDAGQYDLEKRGYIPLPPRTAEQGEGRGHRNFLIANSAT